MATREDVIKALSTVLGPDGKTPLTESDSISGVTLRDGKVFAAISIDPKRARELEPMRAKAEAAIKALPGVIGAVVTLTAQAERAAGPASFDGHGAAGRKTHRRRRFGQGRRRQVDGGLQSRRRVG